jgi:trigger factor
MPDAEDNSAPSAPEGDAAEAVAEAEEAEQGPSATVERTGPCECVIRIEADAEYLRERYQEELDTLQQTVKLPGFRQGRAPVGLVERRMGSSLRNDLISSVAAEAYEEAVDEHDLTVVEQAETPDLENYAWEPGQPAEFVFRCEVMPEVELAEEDYEGLQIEVPALEPTEELKQREMERFAQQFATWEEVQGAGIDWDDYVEAEVSVPDADWSETIGFYPRSERVGPFVVEGVKAALVGAEVGDRIELEGELLEEEAGRRPELQSLAGAKARLELTLRHAARRKVPEVNDELAEKIGLSSVGEVEEMVGERLASSLEQRKEEIARDMVVQALLNKVDFELPPSLVEQAADRHQLRSLVRLLRSGVPRAEAERLAAEGARRNREALAARLKADFLLRKVAEQQRIVVTESEVDSQVRAFASRQGWREQRARSHMEERGMLRALRDDMREGKTMEFLLDHAELKEVPSEEFATRHGAEQAEAPSPGAE